MFSLQRHKTQTRRLSSFAVFAVLLILGGVVLARPLFISRFFLSLGLPFLQVRAATEDGADSFAGLFSSKRSLVLENKKLRDELARAMVKVDLYDDMRKEYEDLKSLTTADASLIPARVVASPSLIPYDVLILDAGSNDGVVVGDLVYAGDTALLGRITTVGGNVSRATLFSSPANEEHLLHLSSGTPVDAVGQGGGSFSISIPHDIAVEVGDAFTLPEASHSVVAFVTRIETNPADAFQTIYASLPENIYTLRHVGIGGHVASLE